MVDALIVDTNRNFTYVDTYEIGKLDHTLLWDGVALESKALSEVVLTLGGGRVLPDLIGNPLSWVICSERLAAVVKGADPDGVQELNCRIEDRFGNEVKGYCILNVLNRVNALNMKHSHYDMDDGLIEMVWDWVFDADRIPQREILFRDESFIFTLFATRALSRKFRGITGVLFEACEIHGSENHGPRNGRAK